MAGEKGKGLRGDDLPRHGREVTQIGHTGDLYKEVTQWPDGVPPPLDTDDPHVLTDDKLGKVPDARRPLVGE